MRTLEIGGSLPMEFSGAAVGVVNRLQALGIDIPLAKVASKETLEKRLIDALRRRIKGFDELRSGSFRFASVQKDILKQGPLTSDWLEVSVVTQSQGKLVVVEEEDYADRRINKRRIEISPDGSMRLLITRNSLDDPWSDNWQEVVDEKERKQILDNISADIADSKPQDQLWFHKPGIYELKRRLLPAA